MSLAETHNTRLEEMAEKNQALVRRERRRLGIAGPSPAATPESSEVVDDLPANPMVLDDLPHGLGLFQQFVIGCSPYPSPPLAAMTAFAVMSHLSAHIDKIDSYQGLGTAEYYLGAAPTGAGKDSLRQALRKIDSIVRKTTNTSENLRALKLPAITYSLPASEQALHMSLEASSRQTILADEVGEWFARCQQDAHRQAAAGKLLEAYTQQCGEMTAPAAVTRNYQKVERPRLTIVGTSTPERILSVMTGEHARSGLWNRHVIFVPEQHRIPKVYSGLVFEPSAEVIDLANFVLDLPSTTVVTFSAGARALYEEIDSTQAEPIRHQDSLLGARLSEQAIRMAALIAMSDRRTEIAARDLELAYAIRIGVYRRAAALIGNDGAVSGLHATGKAVMQLTTAFRRRESIPRAHLVNYSRAFKALSTTERASVIRTLTDEGVARLDPDAPGRLFSMIAVDV